MSASKVDASVAAMLLLLFVGIIMMMPTEATGNSYLKSGKNLNNGNESGSITGFEQYVIVINQENGVNDSTCYPSSPGVPAASSCGDLNFALEFPNKASSTKFVLLPGKVPHYLNTNHSVFKNAFNVTFIGNGSVHSVVECAPGAGLSFMNSTYITLRNVHFRFCGALHNSTSKDFTSSKPRIYQLSFVSLYFYNCSNITMYGIAVNDSRNATGVAMYDTVGYNYISKCIFYNNTVDHTTSQYAGGGGVAIEFTFCPPGLVECNATTYNQFKQYKRNSNAHYVFDKCKFLNNTSVSKLQLINAKKAADVDKFVILHQHNDSHEIFGRGAGLVVYFKGESANNRIELQECYFSENIGVWGGAVTIAYKDNSNSNIVMVQVSHIISNTCFQTSGYETGGGGVNVDSNLQKWATHNTSLGGNKIFIQDSILSNNYCALGGALDYVLANEITIEAVALSVSNCNFSSNTGRLGAAVKIASPYSFFTDNAPNLAFSNCRFTSNSIKHVNTYNYRVGLGAVYISDVPVSFHSDMTFSNNFGSAIGVLGTYINCSDANMSFVGNSAMTKGGAIELIGAASILIGNKTNMTFKNNTAGTFGGAIFSQYIGREYMKSSVKCFVRYTDKFIHPQQWNSSFIFQNNTAGKGNSIYLSSIFPCSWGDDYNSSVVCGNKNWKFYSKSGEIKNCSSEIYTEAGDFFAFHSSTFPGKEFVLNITAKDDFGHDVSNETVYNAYISKSSGQQIQTAYVEPKFTYVAAGYIGILGKGNQSVSLQLNTISSRIRHFLIPVQLNDCPPGMIPKSENELGYASESFTKCVCNENQLFGGNLRCFEESYSAEITAERWIGKLPGGDALYVSHFPREYHHFLTYKKSSFIQLPNSSDELDSHICGPSNRTGILCGNCTDGYATSVNSLDYKCVPCGNDTNFAMNIFRYISLTFIPHAILFGIIIFCNINLTGSAVSSFILFAQLISVDLFPFDGDKLSYLSVGKQLSQIRYSYSVVYGVFNLNSFSTLLKPFCVNKHFTTLDVLCLQYTIAVFPLVVIVFIQILISLKPQMCCCFKRRRQSIWHPAPQVKSSKTPKISLLQAFAAFIFLSYTKFSVPTFNILSNERLTDSSGEPFGSKRVFYAGQYTFHDTDFFFPYGFLAIFILIFFVILPPLLLLGPLSLVDRLLDKPRFSFLQRFWPSITIHSFMDAAFHGFKLNRRIFAGLYLLFRLSIFLNRSFRSSHISWLVIQQLLCTVMMLLVSFFQPHVNLFFNLVDILILLNLTILNAMSIYLYYIEIESSFHIGVYTCGCILVWLPMVYFLMYLFWELCLQRTKCGYAVKKKLSALNLCIIPETDETDEESRPLLTPDRRPSVITVTECGLTDDDMFRRAENKNTYHPELHKNGSTTSGVKLSRNSASSSRTRTGCGEPINSK